MLSERFFRYTGLKPLTCRQNRRQSPVRGLQMDSEACLLPSKPANRPSASSLRAKLEGRYPRLAACSFRVSEAEHHLTADVHGKVSVTRPAGVLKLPAEHDLVPGVEHRVGQAVHVDSPVGRFD